MAIHNIKKQKMKPARKSQIIKKFMSDGSEAFIRYPKKKDFKDVLEILREWYKEREANGDKKNRRDLNDKNWWLLRIVAPKKKQAVTFILEFEGKARGIVDIKKNAEDYSHTAVLSIVFVAKKYRHKGFGKVLLQTAISEARKILKVKLITLEANADNIHAIKLYRNCGFQKTGLIKRARFFCGKYVGRLTMVKYFSK